MKEVTICRQCMINKGLNPPAVRTENGPCNYCGSAQGLVNPKTGKPVGRYVNYSYPSDLVPGSPNDPNEVAARESAGGGGGGGSTGGYSGPAGAGGGFAPAKR